MFYRLLLWLKTPSNTLWLMPTIGAVFAVLFALIAGLANWLLPSDFLPNIDQEIIHNLLETISGSMLTVSTFSLSIMVSAFASAASGATPRATQLVMADDNTRLTIASFISAFIYAVIADVALGQKFYGQNGRFVLFISTVVVLVYVIVILIRWVGTLSKLGRLNNTVEKITLAALKSYREWLSAPDFGITGERPEGEPLHVVKATESGYLTHMDLALLSEIGEENSLHFHILMRPGRMVYTGEPLFEVFGAHIDDEISEKLNNVMFLQEERSYDHDPRYGLLVLSEVAQRALSPAVNDPGTGVKILHTLGQILTDNTKTESQEKFNNISIVTARNEDFIRQPFDPIARDGAGCFEIAIRMQKTLSSIARANPLFADACQVQASRAIEYAKALPLASDQEELTSLHKRLFPKEDKA